VFKTTGEVAREEQQLRMRGPLIEKVSGQPVMLTHKQETKPVEVMTKQPLHDFSNEPVDKIVSKIRATRDYKRQIVCRLLDWVVRLQLMVESLLLPQILRQMEEHGKFFKHASHEFERFKHEASRDKKRTGFTQEEEPIFVKAPMSEEDLHQL
jgi:hypothetical protein